MYCSEIEKIKQVCDKHNLGFHLDGARIWNALITKNEDPQAYGRVFDTISVCLSKGLGTPIGSVLLGNKEVMKKAMRVRKVLGGGMRQIGFMAAAGIYALDNHLERLGEDHKKASEIAEVLSKQSFVKNVEPTETNIVIFYLSEVISEEKFMADLLQKNIPRLIVVHGMMYLGFLYQVLVFLVLFQTTQKILLQFRALLCLFLLII